MNLFRRNPAGLFASISLAGHLVRGAVGIALLYWAIHHQSETALSIAAGIGALIAFRGCPVCWTVGLIETIMYRIKYVAAKLN
jgi:hypothetical protein